MTCKEPVVAAIIADDFECSAPIADNEAAADSVASGGTAARAAVPTKLANDICELVGIDTDFGVTICIWDVGIVSATFPFPTWTI